MPLIELAGKIEAQKPRTLQQKPKNLSLMHYQSVSLTAYEW